MMSPSTCYSVLMFVAGVGIPIMAALNSGLGVRIGNPVAASFILFYVGLTVICAALAYTGVPSRTALGVVPYYYFAGGFFIVFYVLSITWSTPRIGVGNAVFFVLVGQLISAAIVDHFGLFGASQSPITKKRVVGLVVMIVGVLLARR